jgi:hypothetical protein
VQDLLTEARRSNPELPIRSSSSLILTTLMAGFVCACGSEPSDPCSSVAVAISTASPAPVFDWTSACLAGALEVSQVDSAGTFVWWVVAAPGRNAIRAPVSYGVAPSGAALMWPASPLVSGHQYRVLLRRAGDYLALEQVGAAEFTAP